MSLATKTKKKNRNNAFTVHGPHVKCLPLIAHERSRNAFILQQEFETNFQEISRKIPNATSIFNQNGNPTHDQYQQKELNTDLNKKLIADSITNLKKQQEQINKISEQKTNHQSNSMDIDSKQEPIELTEKQKRIQRMNKLDSNSIHINPNRGRKRQRNKQKLKNPLHTAMTMPITSRSHNRSDSMLGRLGIAEHEEGEIPTYLPLDDQKLFYCDAWFSFAFQYNDHESRKAAIMLQEGFKTDAEYMRYQKRVNGPLKLDIKDKSAEIQCKIYHILEKSKNHITKVKSTASLNVLKNILEEKQEERKQGGRKKVLDPFSNEAVRQREEEAAKKRKEEEEKKKAASMQNNNNNAMEEDDSDEDEFFDEFGGDVIMDNVGMGISNDNGNGYMDRVRKKQEDNNIGMGLGANGMQSVVKKATGYAPIRPSNVVDIDDTRSVDVDIWGIGVGGNDGEHDEIKSNSPNKRNDYGGGGGYNQGSQIQTNTVPSRAESVNNNNGNVGNGNGQNEDDEWGRFQNMGYTEQQQQGSEDEEEPDF